MAFPWLHEAGAGSSVGRAGVGRCRASAGWRGGLEWLVEGGIRKRAWGEEPARVGIHTFELGDGAEAWEQGMVQRGGWGRYKL